MEIQKAGHRFHVDLEKTIAYYQTHSLCECDGCRNFYTQISGKYPKLEAFLADFGVDIQKPDETPWWDIENEIIYHPYYTVTGTASLTENITLDLDGIQVDISAGEGPFGDIPNEQSEPYFVIGVSGISLPWVLDTPFPASLTLWQRIKKLFRIGG